ncbi:hypothetical protein SAMN02745161_1416 [Halodesulfovibrio marinisediminis DSM 17456]|uniref:Uncharacterized protein n=1 Tax=Halodesulfovibrio marinisediminis DSM 17456 TaxID=1121457 RepID=A0A1N6FNL2_9BACT|nr:hypothetical protein SAMN02745161_1416 [Halodesulfovibrio marinisediminis DSM 17456]
MCDDSFFLPPPITSLQEIGMKYGLVSFMWSKILFQWSFARGKRPGVKRGVKPLALSSVAVLHGEVMFLTIS